MAKVSTNEMVNEISRLVKMFDALKSAGDMLTAVQTAESEIKKLIKEKDYLQKERDSLDQYNVAALDELNSKTAELKETAAYITKSKADADTEAKAIIAKAKMEASSLVERAEARVAELELARTTALFNKQQAENTLRDAVDALNKFRYQAEQERERIKKSLGV